MAHSFQVQKRLWNAICQIISRNFGNVILCSGAISAAAACIQKEEDAAISLKLIYFFDEVEKISEDRLDLFHHLPLQWKFKLLAGKFTWENKAKYCWVMSTNILYSKVCWQCPAMFCLYTTRNFLRPWFEFSLKVMEFYPGYLSNFFLL